MKGRIAVAVAALFVCGCAPAQDEVVFFPALPPVAGMGAPVCFASEPAADKSRLHLRLTRMHAAKWIRVAGSQRTGEGDGAWQPGEDVLSLETYYASTGMPAMPTGLSKQEDGGLIAEGIGTLAPAECWPLDAMSYELPMATLQIPEGMEVTNRDDTRDFGTGKPGMYVIVEPPDMQGFVGMISFIYAGSDAPPWDARAEAVSTGNPYDKSLTADAAMEQAIGGAPGAKYDGMKVSPSGEKWHVVGYAVDYRGCRMNVKLEGNQESEEMLQKLAAAVESLQWNEDAKCATAAAW